MTKAIEARRELLATATAVCDAEADCTCAPDEVDHECRMHGSYRSAGAELAAATVEYLKAEEAQGLLPTVQLSPDHPIAHAKESDYDHWIGFVCQKIDAACGFEVDVKARPWGDVGPVQVMADDARADAIGEAILDLRDAFLEETGQPVPERAPDPHAIVQRFAPAREGDVFLPRTDRQGHVLDGAYECQFGAVMRDGGQALVPARRMPDGSVMVLDDDSLAGDES